MASVQVSVVIPAYNQAQYLGSAIQSVLLQTYHDYEVIVVDDGSTDDTPRVAEGFGDKVRYIYQDNLGLAGARNTGIRLAAGEYIALLDSDDEWLPQYLATMIKVAEKQRSAAVFYCQARCMDSDGRDLRRVLGGPIRPPDAMYQTVLRANFVIPSTVLMQRSAVVEAGLFDQSLRSCEDWDLWLRLLPYKRILGTMDCLVRYRIHESSLSANLEGMHHAALAVVNKHFGLDDGQIHLWSAEKKRAYGGLYRRQALSCVTRQNDWNSAVEYLGRALRIDPSLSEDRDLFFDLAFGARSTGNRSNGADLDLTLNSEYMVDMLNRAFQAHSSVNDRRVRRTTFGTAFLALGLAAYNTGQTSLYRRFLFAAVAFRPQLLLDPLVASNFVKSLAGPSLLERARALKNHFRHA